MPVFSVAQIKNYVRRSFKEMVDPSPDKFEAEKIWSFFESKCAFCGLELKKGNKEAHIDHLVSASLGGVNHISNRVLACANCNEKEKLDQDWKIFLKKKAKSPSEYQERLERIENYMVLSCGTDGPCNPELMELAIKYADEVNKVFEGYAKELKGKVKSAAVAFDGKTADGKIYVFEGSVHSKSRLVLSVVRKYALQKGVHSLESLMVAFPKNLQGSLGVFEKLDRAKEKPKRYFLNPEDIFEIGDERIAVCNQWYYGNIGRFISRAQEFGFQITEK
jgi:hypothetical protein